MIVVAELWDAAGLSQWAAAPVERDVKNEPSQDTVLRGFEGPLGSIRQAAGALAVLLEHSGCLSVLLRG